MAEKKVLVFGAGLSYPANIPVQSGLLREIYEYHPDSYTEAEIFNKKTAVDGFIKSIFNSDWDVALEDVFTILDKCITTKERFKHFDWHDLDEIRNALVFLILFIINKHLNEIPSNKKNAYVKLAEYIIEVRRKLRKKDDPIAIISCNWDTLLENFIESHLKQLKLKDTRVDYCTYTKSLDKKDIAHINIKTEGYFNVKIIKLHGSMNWLYCSNCGRLYVGQTAIGLETRKCRYCEESLPNDYYGREPFLEPLIITPTLLKELTNLHIQNVWQNAFINLQETSSVTFIGYSLPYADFEFKHVLKKGIGRETAIEVVLSNSADSKEAANRYTSFFGKQNINFYFDGWEKWLSSQG